MSLLIDTQLVVWLVDDENRLSPAAKRLLEQHVDSIHFSVVTIWEVAIKFSLGREDFTLSPKILRQSLLENGYNELEMSSDHAIGVGRLPFLHKDPFDRLLIAQAISEEMLFLTADRKLANYPGSIRFV